MGFSEVEVLSQGNPGLGVMMLCTSHWGNSSDGCSFPNAVVPFHSLQVI